MLKPDSLFYLAVNYFKTESKLKSEGSKWFKSQPLYVNQLNSLMKEMSETAEIFVKTINHSRRKTLVQKPQDNDVSPSQIVQITGHKNLQSINNYSSLRERQMENISKILSSSSSTTNAVPPAAQQSLQNHFTKAHPSTSAAENGFQTIFQGNYITGGVFNINLAPTKNTVTSPELGPKPGEKKHYMKVIAAVEALSEVLLNLKVTLNNSGLLILCIFIFKHIIK